MKSLFNSESPKKQVTWSAEVDFKYQLEEDSPKKTVTKKKKNINFFENDND